MAGQEQIAGQTGIGVKPGQNPAPVQSPPVVPQIAPPQQPVAQTPIEQPQAVATAPEQPSAETQQAIQGLEQPSQQTQDMIKQLEGGTAAAPTPEHPILSKIKEDVMDEFQSLKDAFSKKGIEAKMRAGLARTPTEEENAFKQVYGDDAEKMLKKYKTPDKFMHAANPMFDLFFHQLQRIPEVAAQLPGMAANAATTVAGAAGGAAVGGVPGAIAGGAAGGAAGSRAEQYINQQMSEQLKQNDPKYKYKNIIQNIAGAVGGAVGGGFAASQAMKMATNSALLAKGLTQEEAGLISGASKSEKGIANFVSSLKEYANQTLPTKETGLAGTPGEQVVGASDHAFEELGKSISAMKSSIAAKQSEEGKYLQPDNFMKAIRESLAPHKVVFDEVTGGAPSSKDSSVTLPKGSDPLLDWYNEANRSKYSENGGMTIDEVERHLKGLSEHAKYGSDPSINSSVPLYAKARAALSADRAAHVADLYGAVEGQPLPKDADFFNKAMANYKDKAASHDVIQASFMDPANQKAMAQQLASSSGKNGAEAIGAMENILGEAHPAVRNVKASVLNRLIDKYSANGVDAEGFSRYMNNPDNENFIKTLFDKPEDATVLRVILGQAKFLKGAVAPTGSIKAVLDKMGDFLERNPGGKEAMKLISNISDNNKVSVDHLKQRALNRLSETAYGDERRQAIMDTYNSLNSLTSNSKVVEVPLKTDKGSSLIKKYVLLPSAAVRAVNE